MQQQDLIVVKKENKLLIFIRVIIFLAIFMVLLHFITLIFTPKWMTPFGGTTLKIRGMYCEEKDTIDVVILGNSDVSHGISTMTLWEKYGITSYNLGTQVQTPWTSYYLLKEFLKNQKPKVLIYETDCIFEKAYYEKNYFRKVVDNMRMSKNKIQEITDKSYNNSKEDKLSLIFPIIKYHNRWNELIKNNDFDILSRNFKKQTLKGFEIVKESRPYKGSKNYMEKNNDKFNEIESIEDKNISYLNKIVDLCEENNTQILFVELPTTTSWCSKKSNLVSEYAKSKNINFIDCNYTLDDINIDFNTDFRDGGNHLNVAGAEKIASYLGEIISSEYNLINHNQDVNYQSWNDELQYYKDLRRK